MSNFVELLNITPNPSVATNDATPIKQRSSTAMQKRTWKMEEVALAFYLGLYLEGETTYFYLYSSLTWPFLRLFREETLLSQLCQTKAFTNPAWPRRTPLASNTWSWSSIRENPAVPGAHRVEQVNFNIYLYIYIYDLPFGSVVTVFPFFAASHDTSPAAFIQCVIFWTNCKKPDATKL